MDINSMIRKAVEDNYTIAYKIEDFTIDQLKKLSDKAKENKIEVRIKSEYSNLYQGVLVEVQRLDDTIEDRINNRLVEEKDVLLADLAILKKGYRKLTAQNRELVGLLREFQSLNCDGYECDLCPLDSMCSSGYEDRIVDALEKAEGVE